MTLSPRLDGLLLSLAAQRHDGDEEEARQAYESALRRIAWRKARGFKVCDRCKERKRPSAFGMLAREPDGLQRICRLCKAQEDRARRSAV